MRNVLLALSLITIVHVVAFGQARPTAGRLMGGSAVPTGSCNSSSARTDIYVRTGSPKTVYFCDGGSWVLFSAGGTPGGSATQIQFNDTAVFGGDAGLTYDKTTDTLTISGPVIAQSVTTGTGVITGGVVTNGNATGDTGASAFEANSGDGATNTEPAYLKLWSSHATKRQASLFPCTDANGVLCIAGATPVADATNHILTTNNSATVTGKDFNAASSGNVLTSTHKTWFDAAGCNNATASSFGDLGTSLQPTPVCKNSSSGAAQNAAMDFPDSDGMYFWQVDMMLPEDFSGTVDAKIRWMAAATTGDVVWNVSTICVADGEVDNPAFNTASTTTDTAKGTTLQSNDATLTSVTITGCSAGELMHIKVSRDRTAGADTISGVVSFLGIQITTTRVQ